MKIEGVYDYEPISIVEYSSDCGPHTIANDAKPVEAPRPRQPRRRRRYSASRAAADGDTISEPSGFAAALAAASVGLHVFACNAKKEPLCKWRRESTSDPKAVSKAFPPDSVYGIDLAKVGLTVVDLDRKNGKDGVKIFRGFCDEYGYPEGAPVVRTPSGGLHFYFKNPDGLTFKNSVDSVAPGVDVRSAGGYVVGVGSALPDGRRYENEPGAPDVLEAFAAGTIPEMPTWLVEKIHAADGKNNKAAPPPPAAPEASKPAISCNASREHAYARRALEENARELAAQGVGGRNDALNAKSFRMGRMGARGWVTRAEAENALLGSCQQNGLWREDQRACRVSFDSGWNAGLKQPHPDLEDRDGGDEDLKFQITLPGGERFDPETGEVLEDALTKTAGSLGDNAQPHSRQRVEMEIVVAASFAGKPVPKQEWLVEDLIPAGNVTLLGGDGGTGKSLLGLQLARAVARGAEWIGFRPNAGKVVFLSAEDEIDELHRRLARIEPKLDALTELLILPLAGRDAILAAPEGRDGLLKETPLFGALRHVIQTHRPALLVLDTLADIFGGDEIKKLHSRQFIALLRGLCLEHGLTIVLLSHPSKAGMNDGSGTSGNVAWNNSVRSRLFLERRMRWEGGKQIEDDPDLRVLTTKKNNRAAVGGRIVLRWKNGKFDREAESNLSARDAAHQAKRVFLALLELFITQNRIVSDKPGSNYAPSIFAKHPKAEGVPSGEFQRAMDNLFDDNRIAVEEVGPKSRRQRRIVITSNGEQSGTEVIDEDADE